MKKLFFVWFLFFASAVMADERVKIVDYKEGQIVPIRVKPGYMTLIQFAEGETVEDEINDALIGFGDILAFKGTGIVGRNVGLKPAVKQPSTNLAMVTNRGRTYLFELCEAKKGETAHWLVSFRYPDDEERRAKDKAATQAAAQAAALAAEAQAAAKRAQIEAAKAKRTTNYAYSYKGEPQLMPAEAYDDGQLTYIKLAGGSAPAIFAADAGGVRVVNYHMSDNRESAIVHGVYGELVLKLGDLRGHVRNDGFDRQGGGTPSGTTLPGYQRVVR